jgi:putative transposase
VYRQTEATKSPVQIRYSDEKMAAAARREEAGVPVGEIVRKLHISEAMWRKDVVRVETLDIEDLIQLSDDMCDENAHDSKRLDPPAQTRYSDEEIAAAVRQAESGVPVAKIVHKLRISEATFSVWVKRFAGFQTSDICELRDENAQLRRLAADLARNRKVCKTCAGKVEEYDHDSASLGQLVFDIFEGADELTR